MIFTVHIHAIISKKSHPAITQTPLFAQSIIYLPRQCMLKQDKINYMENERDIISIAF